jgi:hypothetical protein
MKKRNDLRLDPDFKETLAESIRIWNKKNQK